MMNRCYRLLAAVLAVAFDSDGARLSNILSTVHAAAARRLAALHSCFVAPGRFSGPAMQSVCTVCVCVCVCVRIITFKRNDL